MRNAKDVFKGKLLSLFTKRTRLPNGYVARLEVIRHPGAALIVPFLARDKIIILRQYRPVIGSYLYELPAGTLDRAESHLSCAGREIVEETGFQAAKFTKIGVIYPAPGYTTEKIVIYKAEKLKKVKRAREKDEVIENKILNKKDAARLFKGGRIVDAKTICGLALVGWL